MFRSKRVAMRRQSLRRQNIQCWCRTGTRPAVRTGSAASPSRVIDTYDGCSSAAQSPLSAMPESTYRNVPGRIRFNREEKYRGPCRNRDGRIAGPNKLAAGIAGSKRIGFSINALNVTHLSKSLSLSHTNFRSMPGREFRRPASACVVASA